jgi:hypothetical protein
MDARFLYRKDLEFVLSSANKLKRYKIRDQRTVPYRNRGEMK